MTVSVISLPDKYKAKAKSIQQLQMVVGVNVRQLLFEKYADACFEDSNVSKFQTFVSIIEQGGMLSPTGEYLKLRASRYDLRHQRDQRAPLEYAVNLILGWISEDVQHAILSMNGFNVSIVGKDMNREIRPGKFVSSSADFRISTNSNKEASVEFMIDWSGYWKRKDECDVRAHKINLLNSQGAMFLGLDSSDANCWLHNFRENGMEGWYCKSRHPIWGKPTWTMKNVRQKMRPLDEIIKALKSLLG